MGARVLDCRSFAANLPTPAEIRQLAAQIRRGWTADERERRREQAAMLQRRLRNRVSAH